MSLATLMSAHITLIGPPSDARPGENAGSSAPLWGGPNRLGLSAIISRREYCLCRRRTGPRRIGT